MLRAGAATRDITPDLRGDFFGYVRPDLRARGVALRLHAHALVLDDGPRKVCVLTLDLGAPLITRGVLERVCDLGFDLSNLIVTATHTHAGPNKPGDWIAQQAAEAVRAAADARRPARAAWGRTRIDDANRSRSLEAHLANHGLDLYPGTATDDLDPHGPDHPRDVTLRLLRVDDTDGRPLAAWAHFSAHPTTYGPANTYFSADYPGAATHHFRTGFETPPVAIVTNGTEGDLIPRYDEINQHTLADRIGHRVAGAMRRAWDDAGATFGERDRAGTTLAGHERPGAPLDGREGDDMMDDVTVDGATWAIRYAGQEVAAGVRVASRAVFGLPFIGGGMNGPSFFYSLGLEGRRRPRWLADRVHGRKIRAAPAPWPSHADVTVLRVGDVLLLSVPGEPTVETGRRMVAAALDAAGGHASDALVVGLAQGYRGYFTTPEEYDQQHYEGGHTVFGKHTSLLVEQAHVRLARDLTTGTSRRSSTGPSSSAERMSADVTSAAPAPSGPRGPGVDRVPPPVGRARPRPRILEQPPRRVERFETVEIAWSGPRRGRGRPVGSPLLVVERRAPDGAWVSVDDDLGVGIAWRQRGRRCTARYEVAGDLPTGRYRLAVRAATTAVATRPFEVAVSSGLRALEALAVDGGLLVRGQHPPPDPVTALRRRDQRPRGGQARCRVDGHHTRLAWDPDRDGWWAPGLAGASLVEVPRDGLVDGAGNRNGRPARLVVGVPRAPRWPAHLGPGGGRAPGLFGLGATGAPARR